MKLLKILEFFTSKGKKSDALLIHFKYTYILKKGRKNLRFEDVWNKYKPIIQVYN